MIAVTFALPEESQDFRRALQDAVSANERTTGFLPQKDGRVEICVIHTGVGPAAAAARMAELLAKEPPRAVISSGYAGGLDRRLKIADLFVATNFSAPELLALCQAPFSGHATPAFGGLTSQSAVVESVQDKAALAAKTGALAVDMETEAIATACRSARVPLLSVRAISDPASQPLPVPFEHWFDLARQRPRPLALVGYLLAHPSRISPFARFVRGLGPARLALTNFLLDLLASTAFQEYSKAGPPRSTP